MDESGARGPLNLSLVETAKALGLGLTTTKALVSSGQIPSFKIDGRRLIPLGALEQFNAAACDCQQSSGRES